MVVIDKKLLIVLLILLILNVTFFQITGLVVFPPGPSTPSDPGNLGEGECNSDSDCDDSNSSTSDLCLNPGTTSSVCEYSAIVTPPQEVCGDSIIQTPNDNGDNEVCDGTSLDGQLCSTQGFDGGVLSCSGNCLSFDVSGCFNVVCSSNLECDDGNSSTHDICLNPGTELSRCNYTQIVITPQKVCGDSVIQTPNDNGDNEICDGTALNGQFCSTQGFDGGILGCSRDCLTYNTSLCFNAACSSNLDCDDNNSSTRDTCLNPGTSSSTCNYTFLGENCVDSDKDGVIDYDNQDCPAGLDTSIEASFNADPRVNSHLIPNSTQYNFTNVSTSSDLRLIEHFEINFSSTKRIMFRENISLINLNETYGFIRTRLEFDKILNISDTKISLNSIDYPVLNKSAVIYFYGSFSNPKILKDSIECTTTCIIVANAENIVTVNVSGFSSYEIVDEEVSSGDDGNGGSGGGGGGGGGGSDDVSNVNQASTEENSIVKTLSDSVSSFFNEDEETQGEENVNRNEDEGSTEKESYISSFYILFGVIVSNIIIGYLIYYVIIWRGKSLLRITRTSKKRDMK